MKNVCVLGSTGFIGKAALEVIYRLPDFHLSGIACYKNTPLLLEQAKRFKPEYICILDPKSAKGINFPDAKLFTGEDGINELVTKQGIDIVLNSMVGTSGAKPTIEAIKHNKRVAIANKETIVAYGEVIMQEAKRNNSAILPVDSEHSAIYQCIAQSNSQGAGLPDSSTSGTRLGQVKNIILTASGGPFHNKTIHKDITPEEALKHPVWQMGAKITIDSATLMNKGFEVIEASILFNIPADNIKVIIHPQAIIHSMVEFVDNSVMAQMGLPDMRLPIQYALTYPDRFPSLVEPIEFDKLKRLDFVAPDFKKFPCLELAYEAIKQGGTMPAVLSAADEFAVDAFLNHKIRLYDIPKIIESVMAKHSIRYSPSIEEIDIALQWASEEAKKWC